MSEVTNQFTSADQFSLPSVAASSAHNVRLKPINDWLKKSAPVPIQHSILPVKQFGYEPIKGGKAARESEFQAGRFCAQQALGFFNEAGTVGKSDDRSPIWPNGFSGSISHSKTWVWAAASKADQVRSVGIDTETIVDSVTRSQTWEQTATIEELRTLESLDLDPGVEFTVLFSAKEAFYKCWYPVTKQYFDFKDVVVQSCEPGQLTIRPTSKNPISKLQPTQLNVQYFVDSQELFTVTWMTEKA